MENLHEKILVALRDLGNVIDHLDYVPETGRVLGFVVSAAFDELDHGDRQKMLWAALRRELSPSELQRVGPIATLTLDEASVKAM